jgi:hypothetical protein
LGKTQGGGLVAANWVDAGGRNAQIDLFQFDIG